MFGSDQMLWPDRIEKTSRPLSRLTISQLSRGTTSSTTTPFASRAESLNNQKPRSWTLLVEAKRAGYFAMASVR